MPPRSGKKQYKPKPKTKYSKGKGKYKQQKLSVATVTKIAKKAVRQVAEPKQYNYSFGKTELYHNSLSLITKINNNFPYQGTGDNQRIGDRIFLTGIDIRMLLGQKQDRPNVTFRVIVFSVKSNTAQISGLNYVQIFDNTTGNCLLDSVNTDEIKVIKQYFFKPAQAAMIGFNAGTGVGKEYTRPYHIYIPFKRNVVFQSDNGIIPDMRDYYVVVMAYDAYGSITGTDNIAYCQLWTKMYFKDV